MNKLEAKFQTKFNKWLRHNNYKGAFELKVARGKTLPFSAFQPHQLRALRVVVDVGLIWKIPDDSRGRKPFDCFKLKGGGWCVIQFHERAVKDFYMIHIYEFIKEMERSERKSITEERCNDIGLKHTL